MYAVRNRLAILLVLLAALVLPAAAAPFQPARCDVNGDRIVNQLDLRAIMAAASGSSAAVGRNDPRDADGDGRITAVDVMICMAACTAHSCQALNTAPAADAGPDQTAAPGSTVYLSGAKSSDLDGPALLSYSWRFKERPQGSHAQLAGANTVTPSFVVDRQGRFVVTLEVSDGLATDTDDVVVSTQNSAPVAQAGPDQTVFVGDLVRLDGTGSTDVDGGRLTFAWTLLSKPSGSNAALQTLLVGSGLVRFMVDVEGTYVAQLVVSDGQLQSAPDLVVVTTGNTRPVANPRASCATAPNVDCSAAIGSVVTFDGSASTDVDGDPLSYAWALVGRPTGSTAALTTPAAITSSFVADVPGSFVAQLVVNDGNSSSLPRTLNIASTNSRPVAVATASPASIPALPQLVQLDGTQSLDADGQPLTFAWSLIAKPAGSAAALSSATAAQPTFVADVVGTYTAQLIVNDGFLPSLPVTASASTANQPPIANAGSDQNVIAGATVQLTSAGSSDPEGAALGFFWSMLNKPAGSAADFSNANAASPTFPADRKGTYVAQLIVNDGALNSAPDTVQITATNRAPVAVADAYTVAQDGSLAVGAATGVLANDSDPDGDTLTAILVGAAPTGLSVSPSGSFTYTPPAGFNGTTTFQYKANDGTADSNTVTVTITVTPSALPVVTVAATTPNASEVGPVNGAFTISRSGGSNAAALTVPIAMSGTASNNVDYNFISIQSIPAGQTSVVVPIVVIPDNIVEGDETVIMTIQPSANYTIGAAGADTVTIHDSAAVVQVTATTDANEVGPVNGAFTITRSGGNIAASLSVFVAMSGTASNNLDYSFISIQSIPAGQTSVVVPIVVIPDNIVEGDETVILTIQPSANYTIGAAGTATATIHDSAAIVQVTASTPTANEAGPVNGAFTITRSGGNIAASLSVFVAMSGTASNNLDYSFIGIQSIPAGQTSVVVPVVVLPDNIVEGDETVILTIAANSGYTIGAQSSATVTISDQVLPTVTVVATDASASETGPDPGVFTFTRTGPTTSALQVNFTLGGTAGNAADYQTIIAAVVIPAGQASATVTITPVADALIEGSETVVVTLSANPTTYLIGASSAATVTIADGVPNTVTVVATDPNASETGPDSGVFTFTRTGPTTFDLLVNFTLGGTAGNAADYQTIIAAVVIPAGQASATVTITPVADALIEGSETVVVTLSANPTTYLIGAQNSATVTIADGVPNTVTVVATDPDAIETTFDPGVFTFSRTGPTTFDLLVNFTLGGTAGNSADYQTIIAAVLIPAGQTSATITITPVADGVSDPDETVIVTVAPSPTTYLVGAQNTATVTIH